MRLLAGLHYLVLEERASWDDVGAALEGEGAFLRRFATERVVQTNEVQRAWCLLPALLSVSDGRPLDVLELGPSAGLNLVWDRYAYRYSSGSWGNGALVLQGEDRVPPPAELFSQHVEVVRRRGIDLSPVDVTTDDGARLLESFVWADQESRIARLRTAIEVLRSDPPELTAGDYGSALPGLLADRVEDAQLVVFETVSTHYLSRGEHEQLAKAMSDAGTVEPFTYITTYSAETDDGFELSVVDWPSAEKRVLLRMDFHGAWLEWL